MSNAQDSRSVVDFVWLEVGSSRCPIVVVRQNCCRHVSSSNLEQFMVSVYARLTGIETSLYTKTPQYALCHYPIDCTQCRQKFKSKIGMARHKCVDFPWLLIQGQPDAPQCSHCSRWSCSASMPPFCWRCFGVTVVDSATNSFIVHYLECNQCLKSQSGFRRHRCGPQCLYSRSHSTQNGV